MAKLGVDPMSFRKVLGKLQAPKDNKYNDRGASQQSNATSTTSLALNDEELLLVCSFLLKGATIMHL